MRRVPGNSEMWHVAYYINHDFILLILQTYVIYKLK
jgi:hypothetical protein